MVEVLSGMVIPDDVICRLILYDGNPLGESTLKKHFRQELSQGRAKMRVRHGQALFKAVEDGNVTAMIWWDKTRNQVREKIGLEAPMPPAAEPGADPDKTSMLNVARRLAFVLTMGAEAAHTEPAPEAPKPKAKPRQFA